MATFFCPFVKGECVTACVFNNGCFKEGDTENCNLADAVRIIQQLEVSKNGVDVRLQEIDNKLSSIDSHTDYIWNAKNELEEIKDLLKNK